MSRGPSAAATAAVVALATAAAAGCGGGEKVKGPPPAAPEVVRLSSPAFRDGGPIPSRYTCAGKNVSPPLAWGRVPAGARSLALLLEDPDAPGGTFVHWTLFDVAPSVVSIREGEVPAGAREGENSFGKEGYGAPCPPKGDRPHRYVFALYALRSAPGLDAGASPTAVRAAIGERALARGRLVGRFGR